MKNETDARLRARAARVIPGGMYGHQSVTKLPAGFPQFFAKAEGTYLWDSDGNKYLDFMCGYGPNLFGYGRPEIDAAFTQQAKRIDTATGPSEVMVELAEKFTRQIMHADWAMFCKNGTDATSMALMIARAYRGRKKILLAKGAYHGSAPWCTPMPAGTVPDDRNHFIYYSYNDVNSLELAIDEAGDDLAGVFASPFKHDVIVDQEMPSPDYARRARDLCDKNDALLIIDDVRAGFRLTRDSSWSSLSIAPDLSCWGKSIANGHPISALLGSEKAKEAAGQIYATGSFWFSAAPMAASIATLKLIEETDYLERTIELAEEMRSGLTEISQRHNVPLNQTGPAQMPLITIPDAEGKADLEKGYAFSSEMIRRGVYFHPWHNMFMNAAMTKDDISQTLDAADASLAAVKDTIVAKP